MPVYRLSVNLQWNGPGSPGANVWHIRTVGSGALALEQLQDAADAIRTFYSSLAGDNVNAVQIFAPGMIIDAEQAVEVESDQAATVDWQAISISASGNAAPPVLQIVVSWLTTIAARRGRGRTFLGPLNASVVESDGTPVPSAISMARDAAATLVAANDDDNGWAVCVWGLDVAGGAPNSPHVARDITGRKVNDRFAILRSRRD